MVFLVIVKSSYITLFCVLCMNYAFFMSYKVYKIIHTLLNSHQITGCEPRLYNEKLKVPESLYKKFKVIQDQHDFRSMNKSKHD